MATQCMKHVWHMQFLKIITFVLICSKGMGPCRHLFIVAFLNMTRLFSWKSMFHISNNLPGGEKKNAVPKFFKSWDILF